MGRTAERADPAGTGERDPEMAHPQRPQDPGMDRGRRGAYPALMSHNGLAHRRPLPRGIGPPLPPRKRRRDPWRSLLSVCAELLPPVSPFGAPAASRRQRYDAHWIPLRQAGRLRPTRHTGHLRTRGAATRVRHGLVRLGCVRRWFVRRGRIRHSSTRRSRGRLRRGSSRSGRARRGSTRRRRVWRLWGLRPLGEGWRSGHERQERGSSQEQLAHRNFLFDYRRSRARLVPGTYQGQRAAGGRGGTTELGCVALVSFSLDPGCWVGRSVPDA